MRNILTLTLVLLVGLTLPASAVAATPGAPAPTSPPAVKPASASIAAVGVSPGEPATNEAGAITDVDVVLVSGQYSGPGLWKVSRGEHALWILGTVSPVPRKLEWYSPQAENVLARTQEIIGAPGAGGTVGFGSAFKIAFAMPTILRARRNPDGKTLQDVLPDELYGRWLVLKPLYLGDDKSVEQWRPFLAAGTLYQGALKRSDLAASAGVERRIAELAKEHQIKWTSTSIHTAIKDPKKLAKSLSRADIDDVQCFRSVLDRLELDVANAAERANAWATGDMATLTRLSDRSNVLPCYEALANTEAARSVGMDDAVERSEALWLKSAEAALTANHTSFAMLPVAQLLRPDGLLARLQARGYDVVGPE